MAWTRAPALDGIAMPRMIFESLRAEAQRAHRHSDQVESGQTCLIDVKLLQSLFIVNMV